MRDYDFRKNLETKTELCEKAEALLAVEDVISAFGQLQALHQQWKETGPVERDLREDLWTRFKNASTEINKRHQAHFESIKAREAENLEKKTALCEQAEALLQQAEAEGKKIEWDALTKQVLELQAQWRTIGFAPQKQNSTIFERFRSTCDQFFTRKAEFYKNIKDGQAENLEKKKALVAKAQELSTSTDWRTATDALVALQKEWKATGPVPRKYSDQLWKEFTTACDAFFDAKKQANSGERDQQKQNLKQKQEITAQLQAMLSNEGEINLDEVKALQAKWNAVGHVPFKEKDQAYSQYREVCDQLYDRARGARIQARTAGRFQKIQEAAGGDRQRMQRIYEQLQTEIRTYENNIGFLTASSKKGNSLVDQMQKKVEALKAELAIMAQKMKEEK
jgi:septum formation inhibitor MinC